MYCAKSNNYRGGGGRGGAVGNSVNSEKPLG